MNSNSSSVVNFAVKVYLELKVTKAGGVPVSVNGAGAYIKGSLKSQGRFVWESDALGKELSELSLTEKVEMESLTISIYGVPLNVQPSYELFGKGRMNVDTDGPSSPVVKMIAPYKMQAGDNSKFGFEIDDGNVVLFVPGADDIKMMKFEVNEPPALVLNHVQTLQTTIAIYPRIHINVQDFLNFHVDIQPYLKVMKAAQRRLQDRKGRWLQVNNTCQKATSSYGAEISLVPGPIAFNLPSPLDKLGEIELMGKQEPIEKTMIAESKYEDFCVCPPDHMSSSWTQWQCTPCQEGATPGKGAEAFCGGGGVVSAGGTAVIVIVFVSLFLASTVVGYDFRRWRANEVEENSTNPTFSRFLHLRCNAMQANIRLRCCRKEGGVDVAVNNHGENNNDAEINPMRLQRNPMQVSNRRKPKNPRLLELSIQKGEQLGFTVVHQKQLGGLVVESVEPNSTAEAQGLQKDHQVCTLNDTLVLQMSAKEFMDQYKTVAQYPKVIQFRVLLSLSNLTGTKSTEKKGKENEKGKGKEKEKKATATATATMDTKKKGVKGKAKKTRRWTVATPKTTTDTKKKKEAKGKAKKARRWTVASSNGALEKWCKSKGMEKFLPQLQELGVEKVADLALLEEEDLLDVGLAKVQARRLIRKISTSNNTVSPTKSTRMEQLRAECDALVEEASVIETPRLPELLQNLKQTRAEMGEK